MIEIIPFTHKINADIKAPSSKGHTLRAFFIAALAKGESIIKEPLFAEDQTYAIKSLENFGICFETKKEKLIIKGTGGKLELPRKNIFIGNSGVTARFLASFAALSPKGKIIIDGVKRMRTGRPIQDLLNSLARLGVKIKSIPGTGCLPVEIEGDSFNGGKSRLKGSISSQYFSSILISSPYAKQNTTIECIGKMSSKPYIDITIKMMKDFGVRVKNYNYKKFFVKAGQKYIAREYKIEGDYTNASYFFTAAAVCKGKIKIRNLKLDSAQGDKVFLDILKKMGCKIKKEKEKITVISNGNLKPIKIDMNSYPDLVPTLAVLCAFIKGKSEILNIYHLRFKECDRLKAVANELRKAGVNIKEGKDRLIINGNPDKLHSAQIECYNDHRMAMAFSILGLKVPGIVIKDEKCVRKSFVDFYEVFKEIGGRYKIL